MGLLDLDLLLDLPLFGFKAKGESDLVLDLDLDLLIPNFLLPPNPLTSAAIFLPTGDRDKLLSLIFLPTGESSNLLTFLIAGGDLEVLETLIRRKALSGGEGGKR